MSFQTTTARPMSMSATVEIGGIARVGFSYLSNAVRLVSIAPAKNIPLQRVVNQFLDDIQQQLANCRRFWWVIRGTTCLSNQWAVVPKPKAESLHVTFKGGITEDVRLRS
jgi:hypothetical protein